MPHLAIDRDFKLQATVMRSDDLIAKACSNRKVRLGQFILEQPTGSELATELLIVRKLQFDSTFQICAKGLERTYGKI